MNKPEKLIQSYVLEKFFVSTAYRQSSVMIESPPWYYETIVFEWDKETKKAGRMLDSFDSGSEPGDALVNHNNTCLKYFVQQRI